MVRHVEKIVVGGTTLNLTQNQIVCFVGPNSSGKSQALNSISRQIFSAGEFRVSNSVTGSIVSSLRLNAFADETAGVERLAGFGEWTDDGYVHETSGFLGNQNRMKQFLSGQGLQEFNSVFHRNVSANQRQQIDKPVAPRTDNMRNLRSLQIMYNRPDLESSFSGWCERLFGDQCSVNWNIDNQLELRVGKRLDPQDFEGRRDPDYFAALEGYPDLKAFGDGQKAALGLLAEVLLWAASTYCVDEPDVYLHPPQAYEIAKLICAEKQDAQFFFATHSASFVKGLFDEAADRLVLIRLDKSDDAYTADVVSNDAFIDIKTHPVLKFSNLVEGLFYRQQYICEDASDCLFYRHGLEAIGAPSEIVNGLWIGANGKNNIPKFFDAAQKLAIRPVCVFDFDVLRPDSFEKVILNILSVISNDEIAGVQSLHESIVKSVEGDAKVHWDRLKLDGLRAVSHSQQLYDMLESLIARLKTYGIIVVRFGEVESLNEPRLGKGQAAVNKMLELEFREARSLENARKFVAEIVDCSR